MGIIICYFLFILHRLMLQKSKYISFFQAIILLVCFILPSIAFTHFEEGWGMLQSIYYCFITMTTVGLGDMVPAMNSDMPYVEVYKYCVTSKIIISKSKVNVFHFTAYK